MIALCKTRSKSDLDEEKQDGDSLLDEEIDVQEEEQEGEAIKLWETIRYMEIRIPKNQEVSAAEVLEESDYKCELLEKAFFASKRVDISKMCIGKIVKCIVHVDGERSKKAVTSVPGTTETSNLTGSRLPPKLIIPGTADTVFERIGGYLDTKPNAPSVVAIANLTQSLVLGLQESFPQDKAT